MIDLREKNILLLVLVETTILLGIVSIYLGQYYTPFEVGTPQESYLFEKSTYEAVWKGNLTIEFPTLHLSRENGVSYRMDFRVVKESNVSRI